MWADKGREFRGGAATLPIFLSDVKARRDKMIELVERMLELRRLLSETGCIGLKHGRH